MKKPPALGRGLPEVRDMRSVRRVRHGRRSGIHLHVGRDVQQCLRRVGVGRHGHGLVLAALLATGLVHHLDAATVLPGAMGSLGYSGTVQPRLPLASLISSGSLPVLVNLKT